MEDCPAGCLSYRATLPGDAPPLAGREIRDPSRGGPDFYSIGAKESMENLKTEPVKIQRGGMTEEYQLNEKDYGDMIVYDILRNDNYLLTLSKEGDILFMNFDAAEEERQIFRLSYLNQFIELIKERR